MPIKIVSSAYVLPAGFADIESILLSEKTRIEAAMAPLSNKLRERILDNLGVHSVRTCEQEQPYDLALRAAAQAIDQAGMRPPDVDLIMDFATLPGDDGTYFPFAHRLSCDLNADDPLCMSYKVGGCAGLHMAIKNAVALMNTDESLKMALLVTADSPPPGSRTLLPIAVQGDAGSAVILSKNADRGPTLLHTEILTLNHLHDVITIGCKNGQSANPVIDVDSARIEKELMPIYYLNFFRVITKSLAKTGLRLEDIDHFIYSSISHADYCGFIQALHLPEAKVAPARFSDLGHTFASDLIINYTDLCRNLRILPGQNLLFASAGIGFTWGVTIARA
jgi:3-oxoacyl-[acyl-carrier-protein] synthase III